MQAIIMAGGEGTRLRPLTCSIPKPLAPLCAKPVLLYILELLKMNSFNKATLTLMYKANKIVSYFEDDDYNEMDLSYSYEDEPLGTAGCVRKAWDDNEDCVIVISGDALCDFALKQAIEFHKRKKADATIIVKSVSDPREFGLVLYNSDSFVTGFVEKPSYEGCTTDMANTGVYILSRSVYKIIKENVKTDFAADVFPLMLSLNMKLAAYEEKGYWCDIGDFRSYLKCQKDMLLGKVSCNINARQQLDCLFTNSVSEYKDVTIIPPCYIGKNVSIGKGSIIESGSVICDDVTISKNCKIHSSVILEGVFLGDNVCCNEAIVCEYAKMLKGSCAFEGCVIGEKSIIGENAVIESGVRVWQSKEVEKNVSVSYDIKYGQGRKILLDEEGLVGETNFEITPGMVTRLGSCAVSALRCNDSRICVASGEETASKAFAKCFIAGVMSAGADVWDFGTCTLSELIFCMNKAGITIGCYVDSGRYTKIKLMTQSGLTLDRLQERKVESGLNSSDYKKADGMSFGQYSDVGDLTCIYSQFLAGLLPERLSGIRPQFKCRDARISKILNQVIVPKIDDLGKPLVFHISDDGQKASCYTESTGYVFYEKLVVLCAKSYFEKDMDVAVPYSFPLVIDEIAEKFNKKVFRYYNCSCDKSDAKARSIANDCTFVNDGVVMSLLVMNYLYEKQCTLKEAISDLPEFYSTSRYVSVNNLPKNILKQLSHNNSDFKEGVRVNDNNNSILLRPSKTGKGIRMFVECSKSEMAAEICNKYEKIIKNNSMY